MTAHRAIDDLPHPSDKDLDAVLDELGVSEPHKRATLRPVLIAHARSHVFGRWLAERHPTLHEDAKRAAELAQELKLLRAGIGALQPQFLLPLRWAFSEKASREDAWRKLESDLDLLESALEKLGAIRFATKQPDLLLRNTVGGLMLLFEKVTGQRAAIRKRDSTTGRPPELKSPEARAIGILVRAVDPGLEITTLVNVISKIRRENRDRPLNEFAHQLFLGGKITPF